MKKLFYVLIVLSCTLWSCGDDKDNVENPEIPDNPTNITLDVSTSDLTFEAKGGQKEFTIYCNSDWTITYNSTWCKTDIASGNGNKTIIITVTPYTGTEDQNTNITIKTGDKTKVLTVTQKQKDAIILSKDKFDAPQEGKNITIEVKSNIDYQVSVPNKFQTWIKQAVTSKALTTKNFNFTISANEELDQREGYIVFSGNSLKDTVHVYQAQKNKLILTQDTYNIPSEGKDIIVELKANVDYDVVIPDSVSNWISLIQSKAVRTDKLHFSIAENKSTENRTSVVIIKDKNSLLTDTLFVNQLQKNALLLTQKEYNLDAEGGTISVELKTNTDYMVVIPDSVSSWINLVQTKALRSDRFQLSIMENKNYYARRAIIIVEDKNSNLSDSLIIIQNAVRVVTDTLVTFSYNEAYTYRIIDMDCDVKCEAEWCTVTKEKNKLHIKADENISSKNREAIIIIKFNDHNEYIHVKQAAPLIAATRLDFPYIDSVSILPVNTTSDWIAESKADWCKVSKKDDSLRIAVSGNSTKNIRMTSISISSGNHTENISIRQAAKPQYENNFIILSIDTIYISYSYTTDYFYIKSNTNWKHFDNQDWCKQVFAISWPQEKDTDKVTFSATENTQFTERHGSITYTDGVIEKNLVIIQHPAPQLIITEDTLTFNSAESAKTISIVNNYPVLITSKDSWCEFETIDNQLIVKVSENLSGEDRKTTLTIKSDKILKNIIIRQAKKSSLQISHSSLSFSAGTNTETINIKSNFEWNADIEENTWCTLQRINNDLVVSVSENPSTTQRKATIIINSGELTERVEVIQNEMFINTSQTNLTFEETRGSQTIEVDCPIDYNFAIENISWLRVNKEGNSLYISVDANDSYKERECKILLRAGNAGKLISISQKGSERYIRLRNYPSQDVSNKRYINKTGGSAKIAIETNDPDFTFDVNTDWCKITSRHNYDNWYFITCEVEAAPDITKARKSIVTLKAGNATLQLEIWQRAIEIGDLYDDGVRKGLICKLKEENHGTIVNLFESGVHGSYDYLMNYPFDDNWYVPDYDMLSVFFNKKFEQKIKDAGGNSFYVTSSYISSTITSYQGKDHVRSVYKEAGGDIYFGFGPLTINLYLVRLVHDF